MEGKYTFGLFALCPLSSHDPFLLLPHHLCTQNHQNCTNCQSSCRFTSYLLNLLDLWSPTHLILQLHYLILHLHPSNLFFLLLSQASPSCHGFPVVFSFVPGAPEQSRPGVLFSDNKLHKFTGSSCNSLVFPDISVPFNWSDKLLTSLYDKIKAKGKVTPTLSAWQRLNQNQRLNLDFSLFWHHYQQFWYIFISVTSQNTHISIIQKFVIIIFIVVSEGSF